MAKYRVEFTAVPDKHNKLRINGEILDGEELNDPEWSLSIGAISELEESKKKPEKQGENKDGKPQTDKK
jgi:hypothetical protein